MRRRALLLVLCLLAGCGSGGEGTRAEQPTQKFFETPTYRFGLPAEWHAGIDEDSSAQQEQAGFRSDAEFPVVGLIFRGAAGADSARDRLLRLSEGNRTTSNVIEVGEVERLEFEIDGEEAWRTEATFSNDNTTGQPDLSVQQQIAFQHDGSDYLVTFRGFEPVDSEDRAALEEVLRSWKFK